MRRILEEIFLPVRHDILLGVDRQLLVGIHRYQHLTDVGLQRESFGSHKTSLFNWRSSYVNDILAEALFEVLDEHIVVCEVLEEHRIRHAGLFAFEQIPFHD